MPNNEGNERMAPPESPTQANVVSSYAPAIDTRDVFRQLIAEEIRSGRLTRARRRRIVRYGAALGMSAVEAGQLIATCRKEAMDSGDPAARYHALKLVEPEPERISVAVKISAVIALAILLDLLIVFGIG